jgi:hypothetical protein
MPPRSLTLDIMPRKRGHRRTFFTSFLQRVQISLAKTPPRGCRSEHFSLLKNFADGSIPALRAERRADDQGGGKRRGIRR